MMEEMTDELPTLHADDIVIDERDFCATASFAFADGSRLTLHITKQTLWRWAGDTESSRVRAAILERSAKLSQLAASARAAGKKKLLI